ncbi:TFIIH/NER complex subunit [Rhizophlyctis rosea]|nr:TFIIH/NER complex subunit [Rhizophlyctis rosea]
MPKLLYLNLNLKLLVNHCFHKLYVSRYMPSHFDDYKRPLDSHPDWLTSAVAKVPIDSNFKAGPGTCSIPGCNTILRRRNFVVQTFEDLMVEKEFQQASDDFVGEDSVKNYNTYLEDLEEMIFSLVNGDSVEET